MTTNKFSNGKIYRLVNNVDDEVYVGSTVQTLAKRKGGHKTDARRCPDFKVYKHLNNIGWDNVEIVLIENYSCNCKDELKARERYWIDEIKPSLNKIVPLRTFKEYYVDNQDKLKEYQKSYREANKDKIQEKDRERDKTRRRKEYKKTQRNTDKNREYNKAKGKRYYDANKTTIRDKYRIYYEANREKLNARKREAYALKKAEKVQSNQSI